MSVKPIIHDELSLKFKSTPATKQDLAAAKDLKDTLLANNGKAAGLAANMIGVQKRIITLFVGPLPIVMLNPIIVLNSKDYKEIKPTSKAKVVVGDELLNLE